MPIARTTLKKMGLLLQLSQSNTAKELRDNILSKINSNVSVGNMLPVHKELLTVAYGKNAYLNFDISAFKKYYYANQIEEILIMPTHRQYEEVLKTLYGMSYYTYISTGNVEGIMAMNADILTEEEAIRLYTEAKRKIIDSDNKWRERERNKKSIDYVRAMLIGRQLKVDNAKEGLRAKAGEMLDYAVINEAGYKTYVRDGEYILTEVYNNWIFGGDISKYSLRTIRKCHRATKYVYDKRIKETITSLLELGVGVKRVMKELGVGIQTVEDIKAKKGGFIPFPYTSPCIRESDKTVLFITMQDYKLRGEKLNRRINKSIKAILLKRNEDRLQSMISNGLLEELREKYSEVDVDLLTKYDVLMSETKLEEKSITCYTELMEDIEDELNESGEVYIDEYDMPCTYAIIKASGILDIIPSGDGYTIRRRPKPISLEGI